MAVTKGRKSAKKQAGVGRKRKAPTRKPKKTTSPSVVITETAIVISLSPSDQRKAKACLARSGKITFAVREHSTTKLPALLDNGKLID